jgi:hypothetical protein
MENHKKAVIFAILCLVLMLPSCRKTSELPLKAHPEAGQSGSFILDVDDMSFEVSRKDAGEEEVPWANGIMARRYDSDVLKVRDGFVFDEGFIGAWDKYLSAGLTEYVIEGTGTYEELGWQWLDGIDRNETVAIKCLSPLVWYDGSPGGFKSSAAAKIMKSDMVALFSPRGELSGRPELEADATADLSGDSAEIEPGVVKISYTLEVKGSGVVRYFNANGSEWIAVSPSALPQDREEPCSMSIVRTGVKVIGNKTGFWELLGDTYTEKWEAQDRHGNAVLRESSLAGAGRQYSFERADVITRPVFMDRPVFNVMDFGAAGDGTVLDTASVQAAIDACSDVGGGEVVFPAGIYMCASVHLKSNITIRLMKSAVVKGTRDMDRYDPREPNPWDEYQDISQSHIHHSIFWGENLENIAIIGPGAIDGNDAFENLPLINITPPPPWCWVISTIAYQFTEKILQRGTKPVGFRECRNVLIKDLTITHAPDEAIYFAGCENVLIEGYKAREVRVDGIDPVCSRNVTITGCEIKSLDDAIAVKSSYVLGRKENVENLTVKNCLLSTFINAFKIGTESVGDFKNVTFKDCYIKNLPGSPSFAGISMMSVDGGTLDGITADNITIENANYPVFIRVGDRLRTPETASIGSVRNVRISNVTASGGLGFGSSIIAAVEGGFIGPGIILENMDITCLGGGSKWQSYRQIPDVHESDGVYPDPVFIVPGLQPAYGFFIRRARGLELRNVHVRYDLPDLRAAFILEDADAHMEGISAEKCSLGAPSVITR